MNKPAIVYASKYGSTKQYAQWLQELTGGDLYTNKEVTPETLATYDTIIFGTGTYAGKMPVASFIKENFAALKEKNLILYILGAAPPGSPNRLDTLKSNLSPEIQKEIKMFDFSGELDPKKAKGLAKIILRLSSNVAREQATPYSKETLQPLLDYLETLK